MTRTTPILSLTRFVRSSSSSSSVFAQRNVQPIQSLRSTSRIQQTAYHPARQRNFVTTRTCHKQKYAEAEMTEARRPRVYITSDAVEREFTIDEDIPARQVQLKDNETGKLNSPQSLISLLSSIDRDAKVVRALATPKDGPAIVEITDRSSLIDRLKSKEIAAVENARATRAKKPKQIEVNWAMSNNDLQLKLRQLRDFVEKGKRVEILLASKKRQRKATPEEAENVVKEIRKTISEIDGCREATPMEGKVGGQALMVIQKQT